MSIGKKELNQMALRGIAAERARLDALEREIYAELEAMIVPGPTAVPIEVVTSKPPGKARHISPEGRARIAAASRKRWAKARKAQKAA